MNPSTNVGTELLFENDVVRVWSMELAPGEDSPFHRHELDYVYVYVTPSKLAYMGEPGRVERLRDYGDGYVQFTSVGGGIQHQIRNLAETVHRQVLVELKGSYGQAPTSDNGRLTELGHGGEPGGRRKRRSSAPVPLTTGQINLHQQVHRR